MNLSYFISKRISSGQKEGFSSTIHRIALITIAVGLAASLISFLIMKGFQETVKEKIYSFSGHILITKFSMSNSQEEQPFNYHIDVYENTSDYPHVRHVQEYAHKVGVVKTDDEVFGLIIKGVGQRFDTVTFNDYLVEGRFLRYNDSTYSREVVLSKAISDKLKLRVDDEILVHFFQNPPRFRRLKVVGIYETNLSEYFDSRVILGDLKLIQRLNDWPDSLAGGVEVFVKHPDLAAPAAEMIGEKMDFDLYVELVSDRYMQVFEWLNLLSRQVNILLVIILVVVCVNMVSIVLILVMERTQMIGMLKAIGATNKQIRSIFVYNGVRLVVKGLFLGNLLGLGLCLLQDRFKIVTLNPQDYYMAFVPVGWSWEIVVVLNLLTLAIVSLVLFIPTMAIMSINPIRAIKFD